MKHRGLYRITSPRFVAGFEATAELRVVINSAPILRYMQGWSINKVKEYCRKKHWRLKELDANNTDNRP